MKALCWHGTNDIRCDNVPDRKIEDGRDVVIKVTSCAICGSDLHLMDGLMPTMKSGDILGHEFMGEVVETGSAHTKFRKGDRIIVPFNINCPHGPPMSHRDGKIDMADPLRAPQVPEMSGYSAD
jgi:threonine dehydrogenase-like Zn-dependent dehydrogenase